MASSDDVGRPQSHRWGGGVLHPECSLHGHRSEKKKQEDWRLHDYHQASQGFLALSLIFNHPSHLFFTEL